MIFRNVRVIGGKRTATGVIAGAYKGTPSPVLLSTLLPSVLLETPPLLLSGAIFGQSISFGIGSNPVKQALALSDLPSVPSVCINSGHNGGLKSLLYASQEIESGARVMLCGGFHNASLAPHTIQGRSGWSLHHPLQDSLPMAYTSPSNIHYGLSIEEINFKYAISRTEQEDYTMHAFTRRQLAIKTQYFEKEIHKNPMLESDELVIYPEYFVISPLFYSTGTVTSLTAALPSDGAVALQIAHKETVEKFGLSWIASVKSFVCERGHPVCFPDILEKSIKKLLRSEGISINNIGIWEINDFFASLPSVVCKVLKIDMKSVNLTGGNLSIGDTLAASSAKLVLSCCLNILEREIEYGVVISTSCDGELMAVLLKRNMQI